MVETTLDEPGDFLQSKAANIEDWAPDSNKVFEGGETQLFNPNASLENPKILE